MIKHNGMIGDIDPPGILGVFPHLKGFMVTDPISLDFGYSIKPPPINKLPTLYEDIILPLNELNPKIVFGGSLVLYMLGLLDVNLMERNSDIDISLTGDISWDELELIKNFFNLEWYINNHTYNFINKIIKTSIESFTPQELNDLMKTNYKELDLIQLYSSDRNFKLDIFNDSRVKYRDTFILNYNEFKLRLVHPSVIISHKTRYALDNRVTAYHKHLEDLKNISKTNYFRIIDNIIFEFKNEEEQFYIWKDEEYLKQLNREIELKLAVETPF